MTGESSTKSEPVQPVVDRQETSTPEVKPVATTDTSWVPDWLKWVEELSDAPKDESKPQDTPKKQEKPDTKKKPAKKKAEEVIPEEKLISDDELEAATSLDDSEVPSWLKQDFSKIDWVESKKKPAASKTDKKTKKPAKKAVADSTKTSEVKEVKKADPDLPDWLADSFVEETPAAKSTPKPAAKAQPKVDPKVEAKPAKKTAAKSETKPQSTDTKDGSELWDDGMEVPDWLKS